MAGWWGKLVGGTFGFVLGGPLGGLLGAALGHQYDEGRDGGKPRLQGQESQTQGAFFTACFAVMGHLCKADGRVTQPEIVAASRLMDSMGLKGSMRGAAVDLFNQGKAADFPLDDVLLQLRRECHYRRNLLRVFLEIQIQAACADGRVDPAERRILEHIGGVLGFDADELGHIEALVRQAMGLSPSSADGLAAAYDVLGIESDSSDAEVKKAYRRLMSQHHPDKLASRGLPEEMIGLATEKTREIRAAYDQVMASR
ncbi:MAG: co-chaperone DjlA [Gammaproteobacteria bacterium]|nr:co-chaperone DjlA [Gammaproteobacteria bacterium]